MKEIILSNTECQNHEQAVIFTCKGDKNSQRKFLILNIEKKLNMKAHTYS